MGFGRSHSWILNALHQVHKFCPHCETLELSELSLDTIVTRLVGDKSAKFAAPGMSTPEVHRQELSEILALMAKNQFSPVMDRTYPLSDLVEAHRYVETGRKRGNVVVF